ncbi:MAG: BPSS1780 family membrane protein [Pseudomonadota bacterium]
MQKISAATGWTWFKQGFALFRRQPAEFSTLFLSYLFLMLIVGLVPLAGQILPLVLVPVFSMAFMEACIKVEKGERVYPNLLLTGFKSPALPRLLILGVLYLMAVVAAVGASTLIDGGAFLGMMTKAGAASPAALSNTNWAQAMMVAALVYLPAGMCFWFAAPLVAWQDMPIGKALFYSFFAVARAGKAFVLYLLAWLMMGVIVPSILSTIVALMFGNTLVSLMVLLPLSLILTAVLYCSFYPIYVTVFSAPTTSQASPDDTPS